MSLKEILEATIFDQTDENSTTPLSIRLPNHLNNQLEELTLTLDRSKSYLLSEFVKAGIKETNAILEEKAKNPDIKELEKTSEPRAFMLNTNYNNDKNAHIKMLENQEAAAFYPGWREYICKLNNGDHVYLYQSGVGFIASGIVAGDLIKSDVGNSVDAKYSKKLVSFKTGFRGISAKEFKKLTNGGANFRLTMAELNKNQKKALDAEIEKRLNDQK